MDILPSQGLLVERIVVEVAQSLGQLLLSLEFIRQDGNKRNGEHLPAYKQHLLYLITVICHEI